MAKINVLPKHIADLIAAGEVVERPASVVKELMENAIDAGATSVTVEIKRGGITYIRITDNGSGILREDIRNAFKSHATSKIAKEDDLLSIGTLGFRGEALASIAAVARVDVLTRTEDSEVGTVYKIEGSEEKLLDDAGCPIGTTIVVKDIFFNTPARMKFLKKDVTEGNSVAGVVDRIALSHPEVSIRFIRDDKQQLVTSGNGKLESAVYSVFGKDFANGLVETNYELDGIKVHGLVSLPAASRSNRSMQFFFLNGRLVKSATACAALEQAYKNAIMVGRFPSCVLNIETPLDCVDVNVHPAKTEVRFENEKRIFDAVYFATKNVIEEKDKPTKIELAQKEINNPLQVSKITGNQMFFDKKANVHERVEIPKKNPDFWSKELPPEYKKAETILQPKKTEYSKIDSKKQECQKPEPPKPFIRQENRKFEIKQKSEFNEVVVYNPVEKNIDQQEPVELVVESAPVPDFRVIGEAFNTYILVECEDKMLVIDKHAAHERMLFEELRADNGEVKSQMLLDPVVVTLSKEEYSVILQNRELLLTAGFDISDFGPGSVVVRECPCMLINEDMKSIVEEMAGHLLRSSAPVPEKLDWIYHNTACRAAIKGGEKTSKYELEKFVEKLLSHDEIRYCPHGRPVKIELTKKELEKQFGRIL